MEVALDVCFGPPSASVGKTGRQLADLGRWKRHDHPFYSNAGHAARAGTWAMEPTPRHPYPRDQAASAVTPMSDTNEPGPHWTEVDAQSNESQARDYAGHFGRALQAVAAGLMRAAG